MSFNRRMRRAGATRAESTAKLAARHVELAKRLNAYQGADIPDWVSPQTIRLLQKPPKGCPPRVALQRTCDDMARWLAELETEAA